MSVRGVPEQDKPENQGEDVRYYVDPVTQRKVELDDKGEPTNATVGADGVAHFDDEGEPDKAPNPNTGDGEGVNQEQLDREAAERESSDEKPKAAKKTAKKAENK